MAKTASNMLPLGTELPQFELPDTVSGNQVSQEELKGKVSVVAFICNHCPFVIHLKAALAEFGRYCDSAGAKMIAISSNDVTTHPDDSPTLMNEDAITLGYTFPYLYDESQAIARKFDAACTPDFYVFDQQGRLQYRGQFDDSRPGNGRPVTGADLKAAVAALLAGAPVTSDQKPSIGCNIKWRS